MNQTCHCGKPVRPWSGRGQRPKYCSDRCANGARTGKWAKKNRVYMAAACRKSRAKYPGKYDAAHKKWLAENRERVNRVACEYKRKTRGFLHNLALLARLERVQQSVEDNMNDVAGVRETVRGLTTEELRREFAEGVRVVRERLLRLAAVLVELEARGEEVDGDKLLLNLLRRIGRGEVLVDAVVRFAGKPQTLAAVIRQPVEKQGELLLEPDDDRVKELAGKLTAPRTRPRLQASAEENNAVEAGRDAVRRLKASIAAAAAREAADVLYDLLEDAQDKAAIVERLREKVKRPKLSMAV